MSSASSFRIGRVSDQLRGRVWYLCYHENGVRRRPRVGTQLVAARQLAAQVNAQLETGDVPLLSFDPVSVSDLRSRWLEHHEYVRRSSVATINRYRTATASGAVVNGTLRGGRAWAVYDNATLSLAGGPITYNAGEITLSGANSSFTQINSLSVNAGAFTITNGRAFIASGIWTNAGRVSVGTASALRTPLGLINTGSLILKGIG